MKKTLYTFLFAALILFAPAVYASNEVYYTNNEGLNMTEQQYNNLLGQGFTENQIRLMNYETFNANKDIEATIVAQERRYYKTTTTMRNGIQYHTSQILTEEEMNEELSAERERNPYSLRGATGTYYNGASYNSYKVLLSTIAYLEDDDEMRYKLDTYWQEIPTTRSYDIIGIGIEAPKVYISSTIGFYQYWRTTSNEETVSYSFYPKTQNTGGSAMFKLPSGALNALESSVYFNVKKRADVGTISSLVATGDYAHATVTVDGAIAHNYYTVNYVNGIEIDEPYANSYDFINEAFAHFSGTW